MTYEAIRGAISTYPHFAGKVAVVTSGGVLEPRPTAC